MPTISLCMIVKNEEQFLEQCLNSVTDLVDEIIIVDTGSTDRTKEIASKFTNKIFDFEWRDDFSAARNESLKHATSDWILVLDADEILPQESKEKIRLALRNPDSKAYFLSQVTFTNIYIDDPTFVENGIEIQNTSFKGYFVSDIIRLFKRSDLIFYEYFVHETVYYSLQKSGVSIGQILAPILHLHELKGTQKVHEKQEDYFRLTLKGIEKYPLYAKSYNDAAIYYNTYQKDFSKALEYSEKAVKLEPENIGYCLNLSYRLRDLGRLEEAAQILNQALTIHRDERVLIALGLIFYKLKKYPLSLDYYHQALLLNSPRKEKVQKWITHIQQEMNSPTYSFSIKNNIKVK